MHEVWEDTGDDGQPAPCCMLAGPDGDDARAVLGIEARLVTTFEAGSHFEAMSVFHRMMGLGPFVSLDRLDRQPYSEAGLMRQFRGR